jgi:hypothetical protein
MDGTVLHIVDDMVLVAGRLQHRDTLCGKALEDVGENWTDAVLEIVSAGPNNSVCSNCFRVATRVARTMDEERAQATELVREAGMLHGADAANDMAELLGVTRTDIRAHYYGDY